jgi:hypothetical protein
MRMGTSHKVQTAAIKLSEIAVYFFVETIEKT